MITKVMGIVIKEYTVGESDKYITLFTKELGKIQVGAPRAKKYVKGFASGTQLFVYGEFVVSGYQGVYKLINAEPTYMFQGLSKTLEALSYATYFAEFVSEVSQENGGNQDLLTLMLYALHMLSKDTMDAQLIKCIFEFRAMTILGFMPQLKQCIECGKEIEQIQEATILFSVEEGGMLCNRCKQIYTTHKIAKVTWYTLLYIVYTPIKKVYNFEVEAFVLKQLMLISQEYVAYHVEKSFKTLEFIKTLEEL